MDMTTLDYKVTPHYSGYNSEEYNEKIEEAFAEKDIVKRAELLHEAETIALEDMPVIPIIFNQTATLTSKDLSKVNATYYCPAIFTKTKLKDYQDYIPAE
jgi:oligopeptide transport system substrate-binding protein